MILGLILGTDTLPPAHKEMSKMRSADVLAVMFSILVLMWWGSWVRGYQFFPQQTNSKLNNFMVSSVRRSKKTFFYVGHPLLMLIYYLNIGFLGNIFDLLMVVALCSIIINVLINIKENAILVHDERHIVYARERWGLALPYFYTVIAAVTTIFIMAINRS